MSFVQINQPFRNISCVSFEKCCFLLKIDTKKKIKTLNHKLEVKLRAVTAHKLKATGYNICKINRIYDKALLILKLSL
jgi:hypothetical protein